MKIRAIKDEHYEIDEEHGTIKFLVSGKFTFDTKEQCIWLEVEVEDEKEKT